MGNSSRAAYRIGGSGGGKLKCGSHPVKARLLARGRRNVQDASSGVNPLNSKFLKPFFSASHSPLETSNSTSNLVRKGKTMKPFTRNSMFLAALCCAIFTLSALAQDFRKTYEVGTGGSISIKNISGDVSVTGYEGETILVMGYKEGRDRDKVSVEDESTATSVSIRARYPEHCNCNASIRFEVKVPRGGQYKFDNISSISGDVDVTSVAGVLDAKSIAAM